MIEKSTGGESGATRDRPPESGATRDRPPESGATRDTPPESGATRDTPPPTFETSRRSENPQYFVDIVKQAFLSVTA